MGGLRKYMPITWITSLLGSLALIGTPFFSGFYSKDSIIEAVHFSKLPGAGFAMFAVTLGVFVTAFYSFRMYFLVFHGKEHFHHKPFPPEDHGAHEEPGDHSEVHVPHESPWVVTAPLVLLAIPSVVIGYLTIDALLYGDFFKDAIFVDAARHPAMKELAALFHGEVAMALHGLKTLPFWLALGGVATAYVFYMVAPSIPATIARVLKPVVTMWKGGDQAIIDGVLINGSAKAVGGIAALTRLVQTGHLYWYALVMLLGVFGLLTWQLWPTLSGVFGR
jgi:NADH-quinone oxidoreductase subunit L